jgi:hypothetical protein
MRCGSAPFAIRCAARHANVLVLPEPAPVMISSGPRSRDQQQSCHDDNGPDGSRDALTGRCETFDGDACRHDSHRAKVHDPQTQEDRHRTGATLGAVKSEAQAVSPGRAGVGWKRIAAPECLPAAREVMCPARNQT